MKHFAGLAILLTVCVGAGNALADKIYLKSGKVIEGLIIKDSATQVVLDLGAGSTTINRTQIERIEETGAGDESKLREEWRRKFFLSRKNVPDGLWPLVEEYQQIVTARQAAGKARNVLQNWEAGNLKIKNELETARGTHANLSKLLSATRPESNVKTYNALVTEVNSAAALVTVKQNDLDNSEKERTAASAAVSGYIASLQNFSSRFTEAKTRYAAGQKTEEKTYLFDRLSELLAGMEKELSRITVETASSRNGTIVSVKLNNAVDARFLLDTGASVITISGELAKRLRINTAGIPESEVSLADGSKAKAIPVTLASVQLGDARVENVQAVVLPKKAGEEIDGLLGMSFLRHFVIDFDPSSGKLILKKFNPK